jgi:two-component system CheB/CheR fusion protein
VLATLVPVEREKRSAEGRWYLVRLLPYRTSDGRISGVVLTFVDITERKAAEDERVRSLAAEQTARPDAETANAAKGLQLTVALEAAPHQVLAMQPACGRPSGTC